MLCFLALIFTSHAQVQIGSGTNTNQNVPINIARNYSYSQSIYLNSEINTTGTITSIQWYYTGTAALTGSQGLVVYMGTTTKTNFTSIADWIPSSQLTQVYTGGITTNATPGWKTITFTTPFVYNGVDNLVIAVNEQLPNNDGATERFRNTQTSSARSIDCFNTSTAINVASPPTTGTSITLSNYVPNIKLGGLTQTCWTPINITFTNLTQTSATINWENQGTVAPANGYSIYVKTENTVPTLSDTPTFTSVNTTFVVTALVPDTQYYVFIRANCSATETSAISELTSFRTPCTAVSTLIEGFETVTIPALPTCWTSILRGPGLAANASIRSVATNINSSAQSVAFANTTSAGTYDMMLISPFLSNISSANNRLQFFARGNAAIQIGTLSSNDADAVFTLVQEVEINATTTFYNIPFTNSSLTGNYIGIRLNATATNRTTNIDDIKWEPIPLCPDVTGIAVPGLTDTTATIQWFNTATGADSWDIAVGPMSTQDPSTLPFSTTTTNETYTVTNLQPDTPYKVYVRSACGVNKGAWQGPFLFRTDCNAVATLSENFDTTPTLTVPTCWSRILRGDSLATNATVRAIASNAYSGTTSLQLSNSTSTGDFDVIAVSPRLSTVSTGAYRLKFFARGVGVLELGTVNDGTAQGNFNLIQEVNTIATYAEYVVDFTSYTGTDTHFGIRLASTTTNSTIYVDDVRWEFAPLCPDVTNIIITNATSNSAIINWAENSNVQNWDIAIGASTDTNPSTLPFFSSTTPGTYTATNLQPTTTYKVWVRTVCGTNLGAWIGPVSFTTTCPPLTTFSDNFDTTTVPNLPNCWSRIISGPTVSTNAGVATFALANTQSAPNAVRLLNSSSTGAYDIMLVSPFLAPNVIGSSRVRFYARSLTSDGVLDIVTMASNTPGSAYTTILTIPLTTTMTEYVVNLDGAATSAAFVGFRLNATATFKTIYLDNISLEPIPTCLDVSNIVVADISTTSATLTWTANGGEQEWDIAIGAPSVTDPNTLTPIESLFNSYVFNNLTPGTYYKVWVRSVCGTENGGWIGPVSFNTNCNPATTLNENFDTSISGSLPLCWNKIIRNGAVPTSAVAVSIGSSSPPYGCTIVVHNSPAGVDAILVSPSLSNVAAGTHLLTFKASGTNSIEVGTLSSNVMDAVFTPFQTVTTNGTFADYSINFSTYTGSDTYIGFRIVSGNTSVSTQYVTIDNIVWSTNLDNNTFDTTKSTVYPNPISDLLNIKTTVDLTSVSVYNLVGQQVLHATQNLSQINMSSLPKGAYLVKLNGPTATETFKVLKN